MVCALWLAFLSQEFVQVAPESSGLDRKLLSVFRKLWVLTALRCGGGFLAPCWIPACSTGYLRSLISHGAASLIPRSPGFTPQKTTSRGGSDELYSISFPGWGWQTGWGLNTLTWWTRCWAACSLWLHLLFTIILQLCLIHILPFLVVT